MTTREEKLQAASRLLVAAECVHEDGFFYMRDLGLIGLEAYLAEKASRAIAKSNEKAAREAEKANQKLAEGLGLGLGWDSEGLDIIKALVRAADRLAREATEL